MLPNLGPGELIVILGIALIVFGPKKLPEMGKSLGKALREFNKARNDFMDSLNNDDTDDAGRHSTPALADGPASNGYSASHTANGDQRLEYPQPPDTVHADALPYGSDFHAVEGDSQPSFRGAQPEPLPAATGAAAGALAGEGKA